MRKLSLLIIPLLTVFLLAAVWILQTPTVVSAQCKDPSSCRTCHEVQGQKPVKDSGIWHSQHSAYDICSACHGGNRKAADAAGAHAGVTVKLEEMTEGCRTCHSADLEERYNTYSAQLGSGTLDPSAKANPSGALTQYLGGGPANVAPAAPAAPAPEAAAAPTVVASNQGNVILTAVLLILLVAGGGAVAWNERRLRRSKPGGSLPSRVIAYVRRPAWSPYAAGVLLGLTGIASVWGAKHLLGASGAVSTLTSTLLNGAAPGLTEGNMYYQFIMPPGLGWEVFLLLGIFFGGMIGAISSRTWRLRWNDDPTWKKVIGPQPWKRLLIGFIGAMILQYGAGIAGGCTSGLAISGGMLLAPSAFLFMAGMFASGILVALIVYRRKY